MPATHDPFERVRTHKVAVVVQEDVTITGEFVAAVGDLAAAEVRRLGFDMRGIPVVQTRPVDGAQVVTATAEYYTDEETP